MSAQQADQGGLSRAHLRLVRLLDDLNSTVESVRDLTASGEHERALRIVDDQRDELVRMVDRIAADVCVAPKPVWHRARRHGVALVAAAVLALSSIAVSVGFGGDAAPDGGNDVAPPGRPEVPGMAPAAGPTIPLLGAAEGPATVRAPVVGSGRRGDRGGDAALDPIPEDPNDGGSGIVQDAGTIAGDVGSGRAPAPPQSGGDRPLDVVNGTIRSEPTWGTAD